MLKHTHYREAADVLVKLAKTDLAPEEKAGVIELIDCLLFTIDEHSSSERVDTFYRVLNPVTETLCDTSVVAYDAITTYLGLGDNPT